MCLYRHDNFCGCSLKLLFSGSCYSFLKSRCTFSDKQYNQYICESICWGDFACSSCAYLFLWRQATCFYGNKLHIMWSVWIPPPLYQPSVFKGWSSVCWTVCIQTMVWLLFSVHCTPWYCSGMWKTLVILPKCRRQVTPKHAYTLTRRSQRGMTKLSSHSVGTCQGNVLTRNSSWNIQP